MITNPEEKKLTLINVFPVAPSKQKQLMDILAKASEETMRHLPGFLAARVYRGVDGTYVANYVEWRSREDFDRILPRPDVQQHIAEVRQITRGNPRLYELCHVITGIPEPQQEEETRMLSAEHAIEISKPWRECLQLCSSLDRWPEFMPAVRTAKILQENAGDQEIELTAEFSGEILTWRSRREIVPDLQLIRFWSLTPRYPIKTLAGTWFFEPVASGGTRVRVSHSFELADPSQESSIRAGISRNMIGDLQGMKDYLEKRI